MNEQNFTKLNSSELLGFSCVEFTKWDSEPSIADRPHWQMYSIQYYNLASLLKYVQIYHRYVCVPLLGNVAYAMKAYTKRRSNRFWNSAPKAIVHAWRSSTANGCIFAIRAMRRENKTGIWHESIYRITVCKMRCSLVIFRRSKIVWSHSRKYADILMVGL